MMATTITTRLDSKYVKKIDEIAAQKGIDRSAILRSFLLSALKEHSIRQSLEDYELGRATLWEAAEQCGLSIWEMVQEIKQRHVHISYGIKELEEDLRAL